MLDFPMFLCYDIYQGYKIIRFLEGGGRDGRVVKFERRVKGTEGVDSYGKGVDIPEEVAFRSFRPESAFAETRSTDLH